MSNGYRKFYIRTFGCQMNEHDSGRAASLLLEEGLEMTENIDDADIALFNTCTVREKPHHKAISEVGKALKIKNKKRNMIVGIMGCVAQEEGERLFEIYPDLDLIIGPDQIWRLAEMIKEAHCKREKAGLATDLVDNLEDYHWPQLSQSPASGIRFPITNLRTPTSFVTIMKGCNNFCSFCIVPFVRGREVSKPADDIISEIKFLAQSGVKEVTLLGQNVNSYENNFPLLLRRIADETDILRIRYTSPHPKDLSSDLILEHRTNPKLCEHMHLPVQAGSTNVLKNMNRRYSREDYLEKAAELKKAVPEIAITTDLIVGFPGETDEDFNDTLSLMKEVEFDGMFAFKYSVRPGTRAAEKFSDDVPLRTKKDRLSQVLELNAKIVLKKHEKYVETVQEVLVEGISAKGNGQITGRTRSNKVVNFMGPDNLTGQTVMVKINWAGLNSLRGKIT